MVSVDPVLLAETGVDDPPTVPASDDPVLAVSVFPLEVGSVEVPFEDDPAVELLVLLVVVVVLLTVTGVPTVVLLVVVFPDVELVELATGADEFETDWLLQILHEFSRMTEPNLVLIHSAIVSNCWGTSNGLSTWKTSTPWLFSNSVTLKLHSRTGTTPSITTVLLTETSPSCPKKRLYHSMKPA